MEITWVIYILILLLGVLLGISVTYVKMHRSVSGVLRIDRSDQDGPYMFLELNRDLHMIESKKYVMLKVNSESYISQK